MFWHGRRWCNGSNVRSQTRSEENKKKKGWWGFEETKTRAEVSLIMKAKEKPIMMQMNGVLMVHKHATQHSSADIEVGCQRTFIPMYHFGQKNKRRTIKASAPRSQPDNKSLIKRYCLPKKFTKRSEKNTLDNKNVASLEDYDASLTWLPWHFLSLRCTLSGKKSIRTFKRRRSRNF